MIQQCFRDSWAVLRRPTVVSVQAHTRNDWRAAMLYLLLGTGLGALIQLASNLLRAPLRAQQRLQMMQRFGAGLPTQLMALLQSPLGMVLVWSISLLLALALWIGLPYGLARLFGGTPALGAFAYASALFSTPLHVLAVILGTVLNGGLAGLFLFLSLALVCVRTYLTYVSLQGVLGLPKGKAATVVLIPLLMLVGLSCILAVALVLMLVARGRAG